MTDPRTEQKDTLPLVCPGAGASLELAPVLGGKATNLIHLDRVDMSVPRWYAVTTTASVVALDRAGVSERITDLLQRVSAGSGETLAQASARMREWVSTVELPEELVREIERLHATAILPDAFVAVRSSAVGEDASGESFAGLHDSFLFVRGIHELLEAVRKVWASAYNERALAYRQEKGLPLSDIAVAVIIQEMVHAETSGVMFTANPVTGNVHELVISALPGAGEGLVSGGLDADTYAVTKSDLSVHTELASKEERFVLDGEAGRGLKREPLPEELRDASTLDDRQVRGIAEAGLKLERHYGRPQDVEFSFDDCGHLLILQTRPVTTLAEYGPAAGNRLIWDNSNIIESYSGVTSPLTFSVIRHAYEIVYHVFAEVMGIPQEVVKENRTTFANMLGLIRGRVYYNLLNWYRLIHLFPGFNYSKGFMESMMGLREPAALEDTEEEPGLFRRYFVELPKLLRLLFRSARNFIRIRTIVDDFQRHFDEHVSAWRAMDLDALPPERIAALYHEMNDVILWNWKAPIINDFFVMIFYGTLKKLCTSWCGDEEGTLQNDLLCGEGDIESTKPTKMLLELAAMAKADPELANAVLTRPPDELATELPLDSRFGEFNETVGRYLELYGFRCMNELKLEEYSLRDRPAFLYQMIRNYIALEDADALSVSAMEARERETRAGAEMRAFAALRASRGLVPRPAIFRWVLRNARLGVKNRENLRFARARIYDLLRDMFRSVGRTLTREGVLDEFDDVFYLTVDELWDYIKGTAVTADLRGLAALRKAEFDGYRRDEETAPDDRFETFGMVYNRNLYRDWRSAPVETEEGVLKGTGCCPGEVTGPVKVIRSPSDDMALSGEILVAGRTDPGWVPLYPSVSGILIERGSILSHSAIVAREMGIPTIVGIPGLLSAFETGQWVCMDGSAGTVRTAEPGGSVSAPEPELSADPD
jgi:pyruvate,water dikinase